VNLDQRPPVPPQRLAWTALAACLAASLSTSTIARLSPAVGLWFNEVFCFLGVAWAVTRWSGRAPLVYVRLTWPGAPAIVFAAALSIANFLGLALPINALSEHFAPDALKDAFDVTRVLDQFSGVEVWLFASAAILGAAFCEEFVFRGLVQQGLASTGVRPVEAVFLSGLIFALFHLNPVALLALLELGLFFGLLYQRTGSLLPSMVAHATQNATALGIYFIGRRAALPEATEEMGARQLAALSGMGITVLAMLLLIGRHFPRVWGRPREAKFERPRMSLGRAFAPWLLAGSVCVLVWLLADRRGMELGLADMKVEVPDTRADETPDVASARAELKALRKSVRAGKAPLERYLENRQALADTLHRAHPPPPAAK
jgi:membrane protease YdiL (CAAX protease family)